MTYFCVHLCKLINNESKCGHKYRNALLWSCIWKRRFKCGLSHRIMWPGSQKTRSDTFKWTSDSCWSWRQRLPSSSPRLPTVSSRTSRKMRHRLGWCGQIRCGQRRRRPQIKLQISRTSAGTKSDPMSSDQFRYWWDDNQKQADELPQADGCVPAT